MIAKNPCCWYFTENEKGTVVTKIKNSQYEKHSKGALSVSSGGEVDAYNNYSAEQYYSAISKDD